MAALSNDADATTSRGETGSQRGFGAEIQLALTGELERERFLVDGASGDGASGDGVSGDGAGDAASGDGASGDGADDGVSGDGAGGAGGARNYKTTVIHRNSSKIHAPLLRWSPSISRTLPLSSNSTIPISSVGDVLIGMVLQMQFPPLPERSGDDQIDPLIVGPRYHSDLPTILRQNERTLEGELNRAIERSLENNYLQAAFWKDTLRIIFTLPGDGGDDGGDDDDDDDGDDVVMKNIITTLGNRLAIGYSFQDALLLASRDDVSSPVLVSVVSEGLRFNQGLVTPASSLMRYFLNNALNVLDVAFDILDSFGQLLRTKSVIDLTGKDASRLIEEQQKYEIPLAEQWLQQCLPFRVNTTIKNSTFVSDTIQSAIIAEGITNVVTASPDQYVQYSSHILAECLRVLIEYDQMDENIGNLSIGEVGYLNTQVSLIISALEGTNNTYFERDGHDNIIWDSAKHDALLKHIATVSNVYFDSSITFQIDEVVDEQLRNIRGPSVYGDYRLNIKVG